MTTSDPRNPSEFVLVLTPVSVPIEFVRKDQPRTAWGSSSTLDADGGG
ncbi:MAG: hypothetical protein IPK83_21690 [Planctomycetes bacterium]|nr:hypothetical protein [Planctomycetota bacterium]